MRKVCWECSCLLTRGLQQPAQVLLSGRVALPILCVLGLVTKGEALTSRLVCDAERPLGPIGGRTAELPMWDQCSPTHPSGTEGTFVMESAWENILSKKLGIKK